MDDKKAKKVDMDTLRDALKHRELHKGDFFQSETNEEVYGSEFC